MAVVGDGTWLTVSEAVARLQGLVAEQTVRRLCDDGTLDCARIGGPTGHRRIRATSVDAYLVTLTGTPAPTDDNAAG